MAVDLLREQAKYATTNNFLFGCGSDHLGPSERLCEINEYLKKELKS